MFENIITEKEIKFNNLEKKIYKFVCMLGCLIIKVILEKQDDQILKSIKGNKKYDNRGYRKTTIHTIMGDVCYKRRLYKITEKGISKYEYLLDEKLHINTDGKISENLIEKIVNIVPSTESYRKAEQVMRETTNTDLTFETIRKVTINVGNKITQKEKQEVKYFNKQELIAGLKETIALFEEADGIWINLQGKDRQKQLEGNKEKCEQKGKEFNEHMKVKTELKLDVRYEGWKKGDSRHSLVNKKYIAGIMTPQEMSKIREAQIYQEYDTSKIKLRVVNGDGAQWTKGITPKGGVYQKDQFHIMQEITRDVPEEYRNILIELVNKKQFDKIPKTIEGLKYEVGGEEKAVEKLNKLKRYLRTGLERYTDLVEVPEAPKGIEYRTMGTQESQIFSKLKNRFCSGRKAFSKSGANALAKICVVNESLSMDEIETPIPIDTSVEDWIKEIENNVKRTKTTTSSFIATNRKTPDEEKTGVHKFTTDLPFMKEIMKYKEISELNGIY